MNKKNNKGFSLIELVIVITIMVILTALLAPQLLRYVEQSRYAKDAVAVDEVVRAVELALTNEDAYAQVGTSGFTVTYSKDGGLTVPAAQDKVAVELEKTLGTLTAIPKFVSTTFTTHGNVSIVVSVASGVPVVKATVPTKP